MKLADIGLSPNITWDFIHLEQKSTSNPDIFISKYIPVLNNNSVALITFDNGDNNDNGITYDALGYTFSVYRESNNNNKLELAAKIAQGNLSILDFNVSNNNTYKYYIFKEDENYSSIANISNDVTTCWWNWSITGFIEDSDGNYIVDTNNIWQFNLNIETANVEQNISKTIENNFTQYPKISSAQMNYKTSSITCLLGNIRNESYVESTSLMEAWNNFILSSDLKLMQDRKGNKFLVDIISSSSKVADESREQYNTITFGWTELGSASGLVMIGG